MTHITFFDSLVHVTADGEWLGSSRYDASASRLERTLEVVEPCRALLVGIAGWTSDNYALEVAAANHSLVPIAGVDPSSHDSTVAVDRTLDAVAEQGFAGVKMHPRLNGYDPLDPMAQHAISACGDRGLVVLLDTLWRQPSGPTTHPVDIVDKLLHAHAGVPIVLLHGTGATVLECFELGRMYESVMIDLSFTIMRYAGSSVDLDIAFLCKQLDQRLCVGSDFPEYTSAEAMKRLLELADGVPSEKLDNILHGNLTRFFKPWADRQGRAW